MSDRLGTAQWEDPAVATQRYPFTEGKFWLGRAEDATAIGYRDDRHICLVSGTRGGKGTSIIVNNLCFWPGSAVVVDPKGENAAVTAARRGRGDDYCSGMGQAVHVLDPFNAAKVDECYSSSFNPLADLDPQSDETIDEAARLADAIVVIKEDSHEPVWDESARTMVRGLILHVLTATEFTPDERNLITVRKLIAQGEWRVAAAIRDLGHDQADSPHLLLWRAMELNPAFDGIVAGIGSEFRTMMESSPKTFLGIFRSASQHTEFLDSPGMRRVLVKSDFKLSELKTRPEGMTLYLSLPQRYMNTHYRWLRMMIALTTTEMEMTRGRPASGYPVLMVLDEFAGLKRMTAIENGVAQLAGFGVKLFFVLQSLEQLKFTYKDNWETFLANAGVKMFFSIDDHFTREYVSKLAGETEIVRELRSSNQSQSQNESRAESVSQSRTVSWSSTIGTSRSVNESQTAGSNQSSSFTESSGSNQSTGWSSGGSSGSTFSFGPNGFSSNSSSSRSGSRSGSQGTSHSVSRGTTQGTSKSFTSGITEATSRSDTLGGSLTEGTSTTYTRGSSRTVGTGRNESIHRRPLIQPDEVGRQFARIDEPDHPFFPGLALVIVTGANPMVVRRSHYFDDPLFIDCFSPHPDHKFLPPALHVVDGVRPLITKLESAMGGRRLTIAEWLIDPDTVAQAGQIAAKIEHVPPDNRTVCIRVPCSGKVSQTTARLPGASQDGGTIPDGPLFTIRSYSDGQNHAIDALEELRQAGAALEKFLEQEEARRQAEAAQRARDEATRQREEAQRRQTETERQQAEVARYRQYAAQAQAVRISISRRAVIKGFISGLTIPPLIIEVAALFFRGQFVSPFHDWPLAFWLFSGGLTVMGYTLAGQRAGHLITPEYVQFAPREAKPARVSVIPKSRGVKRGAYIVGIGLALSFGLILIGLFMIGMLAILGILK